MKSSSDVRPKVFLDLGDGSWHYNYHIKEVEVEQEDGTKKTMYEYETVQVWGTPTYETLVKAVIRGKYDETQEFALINDYNAFALGISDNPEAKESYEAYLKEVAGFKEMVKADLQRVETE